MTRTKVAKVTKTTNVQRDKGAKVPKATSVPEYTKSKWDGKPQYKCNLCAFDCLENEERMLEHLLNAHNSEAALDKLTAK